MADLTNRVSSFLQINTGELERAHRYKCLTDWFSCDIAVQERAGLFVRYYLGTNTIIDWLKLIV